MKSRNEKGIILNVVKWREADLILSILVASGSLETFLATNALRSKKRFGGGVLEPGHFIRFQWQSRGGDRKLLSEASILDDFPHVRSSYEHIQITMRALKVFLQASQEELENQDAFHLLGNFLKYLAEAKNLDLYYLHFEIRLLKILGLLPNEDKTSQFFHYPLNQSNMIQLTRDELIDLRSYVKSLKNDYLT